MLCTFTTTFYLILELPASARRTSAVTGSPQASRSETNNSSAGSSSAVLRSVQVFVTALGITLLFALRLDIQQTKCKLKCTLVRAL
jgi:hypothetical protein